MIPIARPLLGDAEHAAVQAVLESGELAQGRWVSAFEEAFATYCGAKFAVATSSGTAALHLALLAHGIGPGDDVITTPFTFIASSNAILYVGARPVFVDIEPDTFNIDPARVEQAITSRTKAVVAVDLYGHPADIPRLRRTCAAHGLALIEDACQAHGAQINGRKTGSQGTVCFSFYPSKNMTTGEGGLIATDRPEIADAARLLRQHGARTAYVHEMLGFNCRMTNIEAAIGLAQLAKLPDFNGRRIANAGYYTSMLQSDRLVTPTTRPQAVHVFHQYTLRVPGRRDALRAGLLEQHIDARVYYPLPVHRQPFYAQHEFQAGAFPEAESAAREVLSIPVHPGLSDDQRQYVAESVAELLSQMD